MLPAPPLEGLVRWWNQPVPNCLYEVGVVLLQSVQALVYPPQRLGFSMDTIFSLRQFLKCNVRNKVEIVYSLRT